MPHHIMTRSRRCCAVDSTLTLPPSLDEAGIRGDALTTSCRRENVGVVVDLFGKRIEGKSSPKRHSQLAQMGTYKNIRADGRHAWQQRKEKRCAGTPEPNRHTWRHESSSIRGSTES